LCAGAGVEFADVGAVMGAAFVPLSRCCFSSLREAASGCAPDRAVTFSCLPKRKSPKRRAPSSPVGLGPTALRCSCFAARAELATRPAGAALRQLREVRSRGTLSRPAAKPCAARRLRRGPKSNTSPASRAFPPRLASPRRERSDAPWSRCEARRIAPPSDELSSAGLCGSARTRASITDFGQLSERSGRRPRSEFCPTRKDRAAQGSPRFARAESAGSLLCLLSCRHKKVGRPPGRIPGAASRSELKQQRESGTGFDTSARTVGGAPSTGAAT